MAVKMHKEMKGNQFQWEIISMIRKYFDSNDTCKSMEENKFKEFKIDVTASLRYFEIENQSPFLAHT